MAEFSRSEILGTNFETTTRYAVLLGLRASQLSPVGNIRSDMQTFNPLVWVPLGWSGILFPLSPSDP